jgi:Putative restriction endonuclease
LLWPGAPDFAAEIIPPRHLRRRRAEALDWLAAGTKVVLVIDPARHTATSYRQPGDVRVDAGDAMLDVSDAVPGWRFGLADFF